MACNASAPRMGLSMNRRNTGLWPGHETLNDLRATGPRYVRENPLGLS